MPPSEAPAADAPDSGSLVVFLLIRALSIGGAERQVVELANRLAGAGLSIGIITLYDKGGLEQEIDHRRIRLFSLAKRGRWDMLLPVLRLLLLLRRERPSILYAFLPAQTTLAALLQPLLPPCRLVFGLRSSFDYRETDWLQRLVFSLETRLARRARLIIANSAAGRQAALARGMPADRLIVIGNLIDTDRFRPDERLRQRQRDTWGIAAQSPLIGMAARLDPIKGHGTFLAAARRLHQSRPDARFVLIGSGDPWYRRHLAALAARLGLAEALIWAGASQDMPAVYNALDIATLVSDAGEGFPNAIAEAMATGVPVVASASGDAAMLIGPTGLVIPPRDPAALVQAWTALLAADRQQLGRLARQRISAEFDSGRVLDDNLKHLTALAATSMA